MGVVGSGYQEEGYQKKEEDSSTSLMVRTCKKVLGRKREREREDNGELEASKRGVKLAV